MSQAAAGEVETFEASGIVEITGIERNLLTAQVTGQATPGGAFVGTLRARLVADGVATGNADVWLQLNDGSSLSFKYAAGVTPFGLEFGGWRAIEGTGLFEGVIGGGGTLSGVCLSPDTAALEQPVTPWVIPLDD